MEEEPKSHHELLGVDSSRTCKEELMEEEPKSHHGRRLPPVEKRWKKGISGNPRGRPKKQYCLTSLLKDEIEKPCPADRENRTLGELIVRATLRLAMKGNAAALKEVWERVDGKVTQTEKLQLGGAEDKKIIIEVVYDDPKKSGQ